MTAQIVVFSDDGTWEIISGVKLWTITEDGLEKLYWGEEPKHLEDKDIVSVVPLGDFVFRGKRVEEVA